MDQISNSKEKQTILFIGFIWPEPQSSAAGERILQLVSLFLSQGFKVVFASAAPKGEFSNNFAENDIESIQIELNSSTFDETLAEINPKYVIFDRFMSEEQFGWRVRDFNSEIITILDTEDLHFLRSARENSYKKKENLNLHNEIAAREIASILKCDINLIISKVELSLLKSEFGIPSQILCYLPFLYEKPHQAELNFNERNDFLFIGNGYHKPNVDAILTLKKNIWPRIKNKIPDAKIHICGAYMSEQVLQLDDKKQGFLIEGRIDSAEEWFQKSKVFLAPLNFGAGQKGKIVKCLLNGLPFVTSEVGAEGIFTKNEFEEQIQNDVDKFIVKSLELYLDQEKWEGTVIEQDEFASTMSIENEIFKSHFFEKLEKVNSNLENHRKVNFIGEILKKEQYSSKKFMSRWIEEKSK